MTDSPASESQSWQRSNHRTKIEPAVLLSDGFRGTTIKRGGLISVTPTRGFCCVDLGLEARLLESPNLHRALHPLNIVFGLFHGDLIFRRFVEQPDLSLAPVYVNSQVANITKALKLADKVIEVSELLTEIERPALLVG